MQQQRAKTRKQSSADPFFRTASKRGSSSEPSHLSHTHTHIHTHLVVLQQLNKHRTRGQKARAKSLCLFLAGDLNCFAVLLCTALVGMWLNKM